MSDIDLCVTYTRKTRAMVERKMERFVRERTLTQPKPSTCQWGKLATSLPPRTLGSIPASLVI